MSAPLAIRTPGPIPGAVSVIDGSAMSSPGGVAVEAWARSVIQATALPARSGIRTCWRSRAAGVISPALAVDADPTDRHRGARRQRLPRSDPHLQVLLIESAVGVEPVDDVGDVEAVAQAVAAVLAVRVGCLPDAEERDARRAPVRQLAGRADVDP